MHGGKKEVYFRDGLPISHPRDLILEERMRGAFKEKWHLDRWLSRTGIIGFLIRRGIRAGHLTTLRFFIAGYITLLVCIFPFAKESEVILVRALLITSLVIGLVTDILDGALARAMKETTRTGAILDPLADKLQNFPMLILMAVMYEPILPMLVIAGNIVVTIVRHLYAGNTRVDIRANFLGKWKMAGEVFSILLFLCGIVVLAWYVLLLAFMFGVLSLCIKVHHVIQIVVEGGGND
jgi:CDP-diacylglycerol---glycerol-3-phosphate 3-phosphatidyltransferase